jgi:hypothetical protein
MLAMIVGNVDVNSAFVLVVIFGAIGIVITAIVVKRRSLVEMNHEFELAKYKDRNQTDVALAQNKRAETIEMANIASKQGVEFKRIDSGMIEGTKIVKDSHGKSGGD